MEARELPGGTVTLLFTDIEGSTRMLQELGREAYVRALTEHRRLLRDAFTAHGGVEVEMQGDSFHFAFPFARDAVTAAVAGQRALQEHKWETQPIRVRIGLHTGEPMKAEGLYAGLDVHRAARVMSVGRGGQVLLSERTADLVRDELPEGLSLRPAGQHRLKDFSQPQRLYEASGKGWTLPLPRSRRSQRWLKVVAGLSAVSLVATTVTVQMMSGRGGRASANESGPGGTPAAQLIAGVAIARPIALGREPEGLAWGGGAIWVTSPADGTLSRIDPDRMEIVGLPVRLGRGITDVAVGDGVVWVASSFDRVTAVDARTSRVLGAVPVVAPYSVAVGGGSVWVVQAPGPLRSPPQTSSLVRIEAKTRRLLAPVDAGGEVENRSVSAGRGSLWVVKGGSSGQVVRLNARTGSRIAEIKTGNGTWDVAIGSDAVWVVNARDDEVLRIDPATDQVTGLPIPVGNSPHAIAVGEGSVWIANRRDNSVTRIDPKSRQVVGVPIPVGREPSRIVVGGGAVWVLSTRDETLTRIDPTPERSED